MSHYAKIAVTAKQKYETEFIEALESHFGEGSVLVCAKPQKPRNSYDSSAPACHLIVPHERQAQSRGYGDYGFLRNGAGTYDAYIEKDCYTTDAQNAVAAAYSLAVSKKELKAQGWDVVVTQDAAGRAVVTGTKY